MTQYEVTDDLSSYFTHPKITFNDDSQQLPADVVLIIGESFSRSHSSMYGYDKETNPCLSDYRDNSLLFTFDSIDSPAPTTAESIRLMLSTYSQANEEHPDGKKWFEYTTIIELMQDCGYDTYWFGNQARGSRRMVQRESLPKPASDKSSFNTRVQTALTSQPTWCWLTHLISMPMRPSPMSVISSFIT